MATELLIRVHLDWSAPGHYQSQPLPCRVCGLPTTSRDSSDRACDKQCAEDEIARELYGHGQALITDERVATPAGPPADRGEAW
ncbi:hypothetical protein [Actinoplanes siamensis]|uniref:Uncharacterized protein n=1 Tax=Actinoplanes siamensis TaxID=1223317 RepID=A0A919ND07_9ACTN|nr:hypothetical protein [Actinoplanes siamensis]GIF08876.1 hypothetical protein Asi03nite_64140 [Actinoplanes siamensis]